MLSTQKRSHVLGSNASRLKDSVWASRTSMGKWQACFLGGVGDMGRSSFGYLKQHPLNVVTNGCNASAFITSPWTWGTLFFPLLAFAACFAMSSELERVRTEVNPLVWVSSGVAMPMCLAFHFSWQSWPFFHIKVLKWKSINRFCITL